MHVEMTGNSCLLCFQSIKITNCESEYGYSAYKEIVFQCCNRLLKEKIKGSSFNWTYSKTNCSPFCKTCFESSENLWKIDEQLRKIKKELDNYIDKFSIDILKSRVGVLSKKINTSCPGKETHDPIRAETEIILDVGTCKEEIEYNFEVPSFDSDYDDAGDYSVPSPPGPPQQPVEENVTLTDKVSNEGTQLKNPMTKIELPELRVSLRRLQLDSNGKVIQPTIKGRIRKKRKAAISAALNVRKSSIKAEDDPLDIPFNGNSIDDDVEFSGGNSGCDSEDDCSEDARDPPKKSVILSLYKDLKCIVCSTGFKYSSELDAHSKETGHINQRQFECKKCFKAFYRKRDLSDHNKRCGFVSKTCSKCGEELSSRWKYRNHVCKQHQQDDVSTTKVNKKNGDYSRLLKCTQCFAKFWGSRELEIHSKETGHVNERKFECKKCLKAFYIPRDLIYHKRDCDFIVTNCNTCGEVLTSRWKYRNHMRTHNQHEGDVPKGKPSLRFKCTAPECFAKFRLNIDLDIHSKETGHEIQRNFECKICKRAFLTIRDLNRHIRTRCEFKGRKCEKCGEECRSYGIYKRHITRHRQEQMGKSIANAKKRNRRDFKCMVCSATFEVGNDLEKHSEEAGHVNEPQYACENENCDKKYYRSVDLWTHYRYCNFTSKACPECGKIFESRFKYIEHLKSHTKLDKPKTSVFTCVVCSSEFKNSSELKAHSKETNHVNEPSFQCPDCPSKFYSAADVTTHKYGVHTNINKPCPTCGKVLATAYQYNTHYKTCRHSKKKYKCSLCEKSYYFRRELTWHENSHKGIKPFKCDQCPQTFYGRNTLNTHKSVKHSKNPKPKKILEKGTFLCEDCGKVFSLKSRLYAHIKDMHRGLILPCGICGKQFPRKSSLRKHSRIHNEETYDCTICGRGFVERHNLRRHMKVIHEENKKPRKSYSKTPNANPKQPTNFDTN